MNNEKYHIFFRRVSTAGQDLAMQSSADAPYREKLLPNEIVVVDEFAISANKLSVHERPEMQNVISLIKEGKVHTLYAFDRTRLFRDSYEAQEFHDLRTKHDVHLVYTSVGNGHIQATDDVFLEGLLNIFSDLEGKNISRRTMEARRRYPAKKLGYDKVKETKQYRKDPNKKEMLDQYFLALLEISTIDELAEILNRFRKILKRTDEKLIEMVRDPFYAAYDLSKGENKLRHVEPYLDLSTFNRIQEKLGSVFDSYLERIGKLETQNAFTPICGYCRQPMNYHIDKINNTGFYSCSRNHAKVFISYVDLAKVVQMVLNEIVHHLDSKKLLNESHLRFREIRKELEAELATIETQLNEVMEKIVLNMGDYSKNWKENPLYAKITLLKNEKEFLLEELSEKEHLLEENKTTVTAVEGYLLHQIEVNPSLLYTLFIHKLYVYHYQIDFEAMKFDYIKDIQNELIYQGDEIA